MKTVEYTPEQYEARLEAFFDRHRSVQDAGFSGDAYKPGLDRMQAFDTLMGRPSAAFRSILVAGTNGKGSVSSLLAASLAASGSSVGLYTSPHLLDFRERIKVLPAIPGEVEGPVCQLIPKDAVYAFLCRWEADIDRLGLTFFEITTAMAFWWFAEQRVDIAVVEVGLGGRLDSTNILAPELSIVTSIGLDHCALLGDTRAAIAVEKAGIFKPGTPALVGEYDAETAPVFEARAAEVHCPLFFADTLPVMPDPLSVMPDLIGHLDLRGDYQRRNLATALAALGLLGVPPQPWALRHAAALTGLRGRWERLRTAPELIADIGHNPPALRLNFAQLREMMASGDYDRLILLYGIMADKALDDILPLFPGFDPADDFDVRYVFTTPATPRALPATEILDRFHDFVMNRRPQPGYDRAVVVEPVEGALRTALALATPQSLVYLGGSAFVVADVLRVAEDHPELLMNPEQTILQ